MFLWGAYPPEEWAPMGGPNMSGTLGPGRGGER